jgi:ABC-2 type transport system permease protein
MSAVTGSTGSGAVYDRGYRPYEGPRGGRSAARGALVRASLRRALGLRRSWRQKVAPFSLLAIAVVPAVVNVGAKYLTRDTPASEFSFITYRDYVGVSNTLLVFVALTAPDLLCPDRRQRVLPVIMSRPLTGADYVIAKLTAMVGTLFAFGFIPHLVLFVGQMFVSDDGALDYASSNLDILWKVPLAVAGVAVYFGTIGLALSSLTSRRIVAGASTIGVFLVTWMIAGIITGEVTDVGEADRSPAAVLDLLRLPLVIRDLIFLGHVDESYPLSGVANGGLLAVVVFGALIVASVVTLFVRYDEIQA